MKCFIPLITILALTAIGIPAHAALIGWTNTTYAINGTEDGLGAVLPPSANWTYETGWNAGGGPDVTVNGVTFLNNPDDNVGVDITRSGDTSTSGQNTGVFAGDFQTLMSTIAFGSSGTDRSWSMTLEGLTVDTTYRVQFFSNQSSAANILRDMEIHFGASSSGPGTGVFNAGGVSDTIGDSWTAIFTADSTTQTFFIRPDVIPNSDVSIINGVSVASFTPLPVPEPGSLILLGLGSMLMMMRRQSSRSNSLLKKSFQA